MKKILMLFVVAIAIVSCAPSTKEAYIEEYKEFIREVSDDWKKYDESDWERAGNKNEKFSGDWYNEFSDELTKKEKTHIAAYNAKFKMLRVAGKSKNAVNKAVKELSNDNEVDELADDIQDVGKEIEKAGSNILDEIEDFFDDLIK